MNLKEDRIKNVLLLFLLGSVVLLQNCIPGTKHDYEVERPNIIIMFTDELQFSDIQAYGGSIPTPEIDKLARQGMKFTKAYSPASMCTPSRFAILTGLYPGRCTAPTFIRSNPLDEPYNIAWNTWITPDLHTLPKMLSEHGYITGMSGKWHVGHLNESEKLVTFNPDDDLDDQEIDEKLKIQQKIYENHVKADAGFDYAASVVWANFDNHPIEALRFHNFPWITKGALQFLDQQKESKSPFFLYVTPTAIHGPNHVQDLDKDKTYTLEGKQPDVLQYNLDEEKLRNDIMSLPQKGRHRYAGMANIDYQLGLIRGKLEEIGKAGNTIIIFMSDHNIEPGKATSYEKGIHIPMIFYWPGITDGLESRSLISSLDIYPTLLEITNIPRGDNLRLDGNSFLPVIQDPLSRSRAYVFSENGYTRSVSDGRYKYIALRYPESLVNAMESNDLDHAPSYVGNWPQAHSAIAMKSFPAYFEQNQLYDLDIDPYEQNNIYPQQKSIALELQTVLRAHLDSFQHPFDLTDIEYLDGDAFKKQYAVDLEYDLANIPWLSRDHGSFSWPPKN